MTSTGAGGIDGQAVEKEVRIAARPETVYAFFTDPEKMARWMGIEITLDPVPGGIFRVDITGQNKANGHYVELTPHSRIVFTWGWEGDAAVPPGSTTVEVSLIPDGDGTVLRLMHSDLPTPESRERHSEGWDHYTTRLATAAEEGDPGPDPWVSR